MRILHAPLNIGGHTRCLVDAERLAGLESEIYEVQADVYEGDSSVLKSDRRLNRFPRPRILGNRVITFYKLLDEFDIFHFNFGRSLIDFPYIPAFELLDLPTLKKAGKGIFITYQGCDARDKWDQLLSPRKGACGECQVALCGVKSLLRRPRVAKALTYADQVFFLNPDLSKRLQRGEFLPYAIHDTKNYEFSLLNKRVGTIRVAHAPTDRSIKGTRHVIRAITNLKARGFQLELDLIEGVSREEVISRCMSADIVIDQLLIGWYGGFAVEAAWLSKPVICFIDYQVARAVVPEQMLADLPMVSAGPYEIENAIENLAKDIQKRTEIGILCRQYVEHWHDPTNVANSVITHYRRWAGERQK